MSRAVTTSRPASTRVSKTLASLADRERGLEFKVIYRINSKNDSCFNLHEGSRLKHEERSKNKGFAFFWGKTHKKLIAWAAKRRHDLENEPPQPENRLDFGYIDPFKGKLVAIPWSEACSVRHSENSKYPQHGRKADVIFKTLKARDGRLRDSRHGG